VGKCLAQGIANRFAVRDGNLPFDAKAERKKFLSDKSKMGVHHVAQKKLCAGIDDDGGHVEALKHFSAERINAVTF
jgi:hypothetical protein